MDISEKNTCFEWNWKGTIREYKISWIWPDNDFSNEFNCPYGQFWLALPALGILHQTLGQNQTTSIIHKYKKIYVSNSKMAVYSVQIEGWSTICIFYKISLIMNAPIQWVFFYLKEISMSIKLMSVPILKMRNKSKWHNWL